MHRWGLLDRLLSTGCPAIDTYVFDFGPVKITGMPGTEASPVAYAPRRTVLDKLLVDAAAEAGAEVREGFTVEEALFENGRVTGVRGHDREGNDSTEKARIVIGADGRHSFVAESVQPEQYNEKPALLAGYYSYWSDVPMNSRFETFVRPNRGFAAWPTNDGWTLVVAGWPFSEFEANKADIEGNFLQTIETVPEFAERLRAGKREDKFYGAAVANYFRTPFGPGWALVGDAGYNRDFITAQGISDAFRDAEQVADAVDAWISEERPFDEVMAEYQKERDAQVMAMFEFTTMLATLEPPPEQMQQLLGAMQGNQEAMNGFTRVAAGMTSPAEFFSEENAGRIMAAAAGSPAS